MPTRRSIVAAGVVAPFAARAQSFPSTITIINPFRAKIIRDTNVKMG